MSNEEILFFALGLFMGNFIYHAIVNQDLMRGLLVGLIAVILYIPSMMLVRIIIK